MELTLFYRGMLRSNGNASHKHDLRKCFNTQLRRKFPYSDFPAGPPGLHPFGRDLHSIQCEGGKILFQTLANQELSTVADIEVTLLSPGRSGQIVLQGGDIDNRLKTLFDALRKPKLDEIPEDEVRLLVGNSCPFLCLLEDDALISSIKVKTDQLLDVDPVSNPKEAVVLINTTLRYIDSRPWREPGAWGG